MILAEFNPMMLFLLLWGLLSWFFKKKKDQLKEKDQGEYSEMEPKADLFTRLQKLQDHLSTEVEILPSVPAPVEAEQEYFTEDDDYGFEEVKIPVAEPEDLHENAEFVFETDIKTSATREDHWLKRNLSGTTELRKLMVFKEVLGEPRSLKPYTGIIFNHK